jgi:hypothetical protein
VLESRSGEGRDLWRTAVSAEPEQGMRAPEHGRMLINSFGHLSSSVKKGANGLHSVVVRHVRHPASCAEMLSSIDIGCPPNQQSQLLVFSSGLAFNRTKSEVALLLTLLLLNYATSFTLDNHSKYISMMACDVSILSANIHARIDNCRRTYHSCTSNVIYNVTYVIDPGHRSFTVLYEVYLLLFLHRYALGRAGPSAIYYTGKPHPCGPDEKPVSEIKERISY